MKTKLGLAVLLVVALSGCAHGTTRGTVAMKASDDEAHVCMGKDEVKPGDKVALFENVCSSGKGSVGVLCDKRYLGEGEVRRILNQHYSVVKVASGVRFEEGTLVEKR